MMWIDSLLLHIRPEKIITSRKYFSDIKRHHKVLKLLRTLLRKLAKVGLEHTTRRKYVKMK